jgi:hypothetical protein
MPPTCLRRYADQHRPLLHGPLEAAKAEEERLRSDMASVNIATAYIPKAANHVGAPRLTHIRVGYHGDVVVVALVDEEGAATVEEALDGPRGPPLDAKELICFWCAKSGHILLNCPAQRPTSPPAPRAQRLSPKLLHSTVPTQSKKKQSERMSPQLLLFMQ